MPRSTFALAPLSPFQKGSGSLQIMSVHQKVPSGKQNDFALTRLRRDTYTARAPGVFAESPVPYDQDPNRNVWRPKPGGQREPGTQVYLYFFLCVICCVLIFLPLIIDSIFCINSPEPSTGILCN